MDRVSTLESFRRTLVPQEEHTRHAFEILNYNQGLIQFADNKANTLILINSIALATATGIHVAVPPEWAGEAWGVKMAFLVTSVASIVACLRVVAVRNANTERMRHYDLVFFGDIVAHQTARCYRSQFLRMEPGAFLDDLIECNFRLASIADAKYRHYAWAQRTTVLACGLWMALVVASQLCGGG